MLTVDQARQYAAEVAQRVRDGKSRTNFNAGEVLVLGSSRSSRSEQDTALYIVNFDDEQGYAIVSPYAIKDPVLAVIEQGSFNPSDLEEDTPFAEYVEAIRAKSIEVRDSLIAKPIFPHEQNKIVNTVDTIISIAPRAPQPWGQFSPFGDKCPHDRCGCVALSCILTMQYYQHPKSLQLTYPDHDKSAINIDWGTMSRHGMTATTTAQICHNDVNDPMHEVMRYLGREISHRVNTLYTFDVALSTLSEAWNLMRDLGYNVSEIKNLTQNAHLVSLINNGILIVGGQLSDQSEPGLFVPKKGGHCWIIDGMKTYHNKSVTYISRDGGRTWQIEPNLSSEWDVSYVHVNWGFWGRNNGYFSFPSSCMTEPDEYDSDVDNRYKYIWENISGFSAGRPYNAQ